MRSLTRACLLLSAAVSTGCAVNPQPHAPGAAQGVVAEESVRGHMEFLASDAMNGRGSGTRDEWIAATYFGAQMRRLGLEPLGDDGSYVQTIGIQRRQASAPPVMSVEGRRYTHGKEILIQSLSAQQLSGPLQKFTEGQAFEAGAVLLMPETTRSNFPAEAAGAAAVLLLETAQHRGRWGQLGERLPPVGSSLAGVQAPPRPAVVILARQTYDVIAGLSHGVPVSLETEVTAFPTTLTWNAVGSLPGADAASASEVILLSAHLDHVGNRPARDGVTIADTIYNGADDDASGTVAVLELAQALVRGPRPRRTIVFAFFGSEEAGGHGSTYFADKPVVPLTQIVANLQFEMIGRPDPKVPPHTLWLTGYERSTLGSSLARQGAKLVQDPHPEQNFFTRSDNIQFARRGVVAHTVSSFGLHEGYHRPSDELRFIDFAHMTDAIRSMLGPIRWLANSGFRPEWLPGGRP